MIERRLAELREELRKGQQHLSILDQQRAEIRDMLLRISGAIHVLQELLASTAEEGGREPGPHRSAA
jgi:hypothetical protein